MSFRGYPVVCYDPESRSSQIFAEAFSRGISKPGQCVDYRTLPEQLHPTGIAMFPSPASFDVVLRARRQSVPWYYADHGYFDRLRHYRITRSGFQFQGRQRGSAGHYFSQFGRPIKSWTLAGAHVLIALNGPKHMALHSQPSNEEWVATVSAELRRWTSREIRVREKPLRGTCVPIDEDLAECWAVVTYSSNSAVDALIAGVPVFVLAPVAAAYRMGLHDLSRIETPIYPEGRHSFLTALAQNQWTLPEIKRGKAWEGLCRN